MRLPDDSMEPTGATVLPDDYVLSSDANGNVCIVERPDMGRTSFSVAADGTLGAGANFTGTTRLANFQTQSRYARMVCMKVTISYVGSDLNAAGYLTVTKKSSTNDISNLNISSIHNDADLQVRAHQGATVFGNFRHSPRFEDPSTLYGAVPSVVNGFMCSTFPFIVIAASGLPISAPVLKVRVLRFMEFIPQTGSIAEGSQMIEPANPAAMHVAGMLSTTLTSMFANDEKGTFLSRIEKAANAAYHVVQPYQQYVVPAATALLKAL